MQITGSSESLALKLFDLGKKMRIVIQKGKLEVLFNLETFTC